MSEPRSSKPWRLILLTMGTLLLIIVPFLMFGEPLERWTGQFIRRGAAHRGLVALVLGGLLAGDIFLPVPSSLVSTACGSCLGFASGTLVSFAGMTVSAVAGYIIGRMASGAAHRMLRDGELDMLSRLHGRWGVWMLAAVRPVPVLAEASILFAGLSRLPWRGALPLVLLANLAVSAVYAAIGAWAAGRDATLLAFAAAGALSGLAMLLARRK